MEKRIGVVAILIEDKTSVPTINSLLTTYADIVCGRLGLPLRNKGVNIITLIVEGTTDQIGALTGKIGRLPGVQVKSLFTKYREHDDGEHPGTS
jgi:putative iron-only hydrogenase system regulator